MKKNIQKIIEMVRSGRMNKNSEEMHQISTTKTNNAINTSPYLHFLCKIHLNRHCEDFDQWNF